jgi:hypothetical protein
MLGVGPTGFTTVVTKDGDAEALIELDGRLVDLGQAERAPTVAQQSVGAAERLAERSAASLGGAHNIVLGVSHSYHFRGASWAI